MTMQAISNRRFGAIESVVQGLAESVTVPVGAWRARQLTRQPPAHADHSARAGERKLQLMLDTLPTLAWSARPDGGADFFNLPFLQFLGYPASHAAGWGWTAALHPDDRAGLIQAWQRILDAGTPGETEARLRRHDGEYRWFLMRVHPLRDAAGSITRWYGANTDVEERKRAETSRAVALGTLTASIAHEVRQPLSGILTNAGTCLRMLEAERLNLEGAREAARRILRDANRASAVVTRLRAMFSGREFTPETVDLNEATREVIALSMGDLQRNQVSLQSRLAEDLPAIGGDRIQLQQVILNLLRNASEAMADVDDRPRQLVITTEREGAGWVRLVVRDAGVGLERDCSATLFEPFYTTKADGMGIGLSVSRSIIERHAGRIWAEPNDGPGATVAFSLPVMAA